MYSMAFKKKEPSYFALIDCNNFYVSCEQVFNPSLKGKPVVILSNNDGCIVSRSYEAKQLQIPMAAPYFEYKRHFEAHGGIALSSNYELYADMSDRVMQSLQSFGFDTEIYSIDEAFMLLPLPLNELEAIAKQIRDALLKWTGLPVSIGIANTKVLAKIANHEAKKSKKGLWIATKNSLCDLLSTLPVEEIWGISYKLGQKLRAMSLQSAKQLQEADPLQIRKALSLSVEKIVWELRGVSCLRLEEASVRKTILCSRSFSKPISELNQLEQALSSYVHKASEKLRAQHSKAQGICVFVRTSHHNHTQKYYSNSTNRSILATSHTPTLIQEALKGLKSIFKEEYAYQKVGVIFWSLIEANQQTADCFTPSSSSKNDRLMQAFDAINKRMGKEALFYASQGIQRSWSTRSDHRTGRYTTSWNELPLAY